ncbi:hypothetical protein [Isoptericola hypogeus]
MRATRTRRGARRRGAPRGLRRPLPPGWARRSSLAASAAVGLLLGVATGLGVDVLGGGSPPDARPEVSVEPATCAQAQVAWSRAAAAQVAMSGDDPGTLRRGFVEASAALTTASPPEPVAADWRTVSDYLAAVAAALEDVKGDSEVTGAVAGALDELDTPAMTAAFDRVTRYLKAGCAAG